MNQSMLLFTRFLLLASLGAASWSPQAVAQSALDTNEADPSPGWRILGNGYAQLQNATDAAAAFSLGLGYSGPEELLEVTLNVRRSTNPVLLTKTKEFGQFILAPGLASSAGEASTSYRPIVVQGGVGRMGPYGYFRVGNAEWEVANPDMPGTTLKDNAIATAIGVGWGTKLKTQVGDTNDIALSFGGGLALRMLGGDVTNRPELRQLAIGRMQQVFIGIEASALLQINDIGVGLEVPLILGNVRGLTNGQLLISLTLGGAVKLGG